MTLPGGTVCIIYPAQLGNSWNGPDRMVSMVSVGSFLLNTFPTPKPVFCRSIPRQVCRAQEAQERFTVNLRLCVLSRGKC